MKKKTEIILLLIVGTLFAIFVFGLAFSYWVMESLPVPKDAMAKVQVGMTKDAVQSILGKPDKIYKRDEVEEWVYSGTFQWQMFKVYFSENGSVTATDYDR